jgi:hypothetical protein
MAGMTGQNRKRQTKAIIRADLEIAGISAKDRQTPAFLSRISLMKPNRVDKVFFSW